MTSTRATLESRQNRATNPPVAVGYNHVCQNDRMAFVHSCPDEHAAIDYAIRCQRDRRNLADSDILRCVEVLDMVLSVLRGEIGAGVPEQVTE